MSGPSRARRAMVVSAAVVAAVVVGGVPAPAGVQHSVVVGETPTTATPRVADGTVRAIAQVGSRVFLGGDFTSATSRGSTTAVARRSILAFDAATGVIDAGFAPALDGEVRQIIPGPAGSVYVAGNFRTVNGVSTRVARLNAATGAIVPGWRPASMNGATSTVTLSGSTVYVGGSFTTVGGLARGGLVALDAGTGAVQPWFAVSVAGRHGTGSAVSATGVRRVDVSPDGRQLVVIGNFTSVTDSVGTVDRDQVMLLDVAPGVSVLVDRDWRTLAYTAQCHNWSFSSTVRDVQYSPDGSYFVIVTTGGGRGTNTDGSKGLCDAAARWESAGVGSNVRPTWVGYTGGDSLWSVAVTGAAVYVGGHQRWMNNDHGVTINYASAGAVPRPGVAALDPVSGVPLRWNPGRNPRGAGAYAILATPSTLYVGSDTEWIGNYRYRRERIAA
ncbi:MAG: hypothetical protein ACRC35_13345, partial [Angustibacter sp.]